MGPPILQFIMGIMGILTPRIRHLNQVLFFVKIYFQSPVFYNGVLHLFLPCVSFTLILQQETEKTKLCPVSLKLLIEDKTLTVTLIKC